MYKTTLLLLLKLLSIEYRFKAHLHILAVLDHYISYEMIKLNNAQE